MSIFHRPMAMYHLSITKITQFLLWRITPLCIIPQATNIILDVRAPNNECMNHQN